MTDRIVVDYLIYGNDAREIAEAISVEQSIEFPAELAEAWIQREVVGQIDSIGEQVDGATSVTISYDHRNAGGELPQLLNVLWGNVSMLRGVRLIDVSIPDVLTKKFSGPRFGVAGLRELFDVPKRALVGTALKPMGSSSADFARMASILATAGFDTIKDDHSLANQPWSMWRERVEVVSAAVREANEKTGNRCVYAPSLNLPADQIQDAAREAKSLGAGALMVLPGISGFDIMRTIAEDDSIALPMMGHPSMLGSLVVSQNEGIAHSVVYGTLMRLAGADISIFPNFSGRFAFTKDECRSIAKAARRPLGTLAPMWISPAGGMTIERLPEMLDFYGRDTAALVGGALHRGDLAANAVQMVEVMRG
ncbi:ribulose-bisphosphate carboxylase large chain [Rhodoglobus vestalii]|uniref:Ribulose-bisphosphate carboxylase large chain n=1 Tax=Rhodoglobus vestalii TaxID=193384 RepID=A0A8H2K8A0_9MICO|nr:RuBisCO large subunit C-terminal-like domain-containing protein [Rhodoglobus vestalii]TQO20688.1 ribulose-bisphosphate carboxylase large chain [Rhodoglobus vestalii]